MSPFRLASRMKVEGSNRSPAPAHGAPPGAINGYLVAEGSEKGGESEMRMKYPGRRSHFSGAVRFGTLVTHLEIRVALLAACTLQR
jgi:hypothetical protein